MRHNAVFFSLILLAAPAFAQTMRGKVMMPDGSPPPRRALIERVCSGAAPVQEALTGKNGEFFWRVFADSPGTRGSVLMRCYLRARVKNLASDLIDLQDRKIMSNIQLPTMILRPMGQAAAGPALPPAALKKWNAAVQAYKAEQWAAAERLAREVAAAAPEFALAWNAAGLAASAQKKYPEARDALRRAIAADPASAPHRVQLARVEIAMQLWADAAKSAEAARQADKANAHPEIDLNYGIARYMLDDREGARASWERYLERAPSAPDAVIVRAKLAEMRAGNQTAPSVPETLLTAAPEPEFAAAAEATVPGGRKALAAMAHLAAVPPPAEFFLEYARAIATQTSRTTANPLPKFAETLQQYLVSVSELADLGERAGDRTLFRLSAADPKTGRVLAALGWRVRQRDGKTIVEPGDQSADGARQSIPRALGIDQWTMKQTLEAGRTFEFAIESETAPIAGGAAWNAELRAFPSLPGGIAEAFARDGRLARAYAGLAAMPPELSTALAKRVTLRVLLEQHALALWLYGDTFQLASGAAAVPGGSGAEALWTKLAGASPRDPARFFEALLLADRGRVAAFYAALARAGEAHQRFFTATAARAQRFAAWYRESDELRDGVGSAAPGWATRVFSALPLDPQGRIAFPGGREVWNAASDDDALPYLEKVVALADLERRRARPLDAASARLLARHFAEWRALFPYFETLAGLGADEFDALAQFAARTAALDRARQEAAMRQWHSAAALIVLGRKSGALDDPAAARAFGALCRSGDALATLRGIVPSAADLDGAVTEGLLRLDPERRAAFRRIRALQHAPTLAAATQADDPAAIGEALSGAVYGALLAPDALLLHEDRALLSKHVFVPRSGPLFAGAGFSGAHFTGGFMNFDDAARRLTSAGRIPPESEETAGNGSSESAETLFKANARLVEINATVTDDRGRLVGGLRADHFAILDNGRAASIVAFENSSAALSCVLLLDTSQSMDSAVAALKAAAMRLIGGLRPDDSVAVYSLTGGITELQPFTTDKTAATRAVLDAEIGELTALYDGLVRVNRDLAGRAGKKVIIVLTDGEDNASALSAEFAVLRAKTAGVPIYTIAQGHAIREAALLKELGAVSQATGGMAFAIPTAAEIGPVFDRVLDDLLHGYLLAFAPHPSEDRSWKPIEVRLLAPGKVRAREGYYPE